MSRNSYFDDYGFDHTQKEYAQVLEEARRHARAVAALESQPRDESFRRNRQDLVNAEISSSQAHFKADDLKRSLGDMKKRKSWKNTLFFWRKSGSSKKDKEVPATVQFPRCPTSKSQSQPPSGPIYPNDLYIVTSSGLPSRPKSGPMGTRLGENHDDESEMQYTSLAHHTHLRIPHTGPIYTVS